jgi:hypothetical protein
VKDPNCLEGYRSDVEVLAAELVRMWRDDPSPHGRPCCSVRSGTYRGGEGGCMKRSMPLSLLCLPRHLRRSYERRVDAMPFHWGPVE